jgi:selenide,water dikinase
LDQVLSALPRVANPNVLVGFDTADDAGVYRLTDELALVQTVDFFTPIVDDPYTFGAIAAANSLSDVYAMGGVPISALSVVAWPGGADANVLGQILRGGLDKMTEASCAVIGGHSVNDPEIKFGYAVTGTVHPQRIKSNAGARVGDILVLTKAIGTGVIGTALKRGIATDEAVDASTACMLRLNRAACEAMLQCDVTGCTDITGFGLAGHARELALASGVTIEIEAASVPLLPGALEAAAAGAIPGGLKNNIEFVECAVEEPANLNPALRSLLYDPQTSGGLLIPVAARDAERLCAAIPGAVPIGRVVARDAKPIRIL